MGSSGKKKTTMAKLTRESRLRERRLDKKARKEARKLSAANGEIEPETTLDGEVDAETTLDDMPEDSVAVEAPASVQE